MARPKRDDTIRSIINLLCTMEDATTKEDKMILLKKVAQVLFEQEAVKQRKVSKKRASKSKNNNTAQS